MWMLKSVAMKFDSLMIIEVLLQIQILINNFFLKKKDIAPAPNVAYNKAFWSGSWRVIVQTLRKIKTGEEIVVDYGATYWDE